jgi:hypothetical protein
VSTAKGQERRWLACLPMLWRRHGGIFQHSQNGIMDSHPNAVPFLTARLEHAPSCFFFPLHGNLNCLWCATDKDKEIKKI